MMTTNEILNSQYKFFINGETLSYEFRLNALKKLYYAIKKRQDEISNALKSDLSKSGFESYTSEIGFSLMEIKYLTKNLKKFMKPKRVKTELLNFPANSKIYSEPFGNVLIMSPWNYPFLLTISPLAGAIAAGNTAILKPSNYSVATSKVMKDIISGIFHENYIALIEGDRYVNQDLLNLKFDYIFFTGSKAVGKIVMEKASKHLTPVSLELGGKSPTIVDKSAKIALAAKRIAWGKSLNSGQTCVAPDYCLVHQSIAKEFTLELKKAFIELNGENAENNVNYPKIINEKKYERLKGLLNSSDIIFGGAYSDLNEKIAPTIVNANWDSEIMKEEIFGPIMPIIQYEDIDDIITKIKSRPRPLALYIFTEDADIKNKILSRISFGGGCVNDTIMHLASSHMPFGGVGDSGMGGYHGKYSFDTFSHKKSVLDKFTFMDVKTRYGNNYEKDFNLVKKLLK